MKILHTIKLLPVVKPTKMTRNQSTCRRTDKYLYPSNYTLAWNKNELKIPGATDNNCSG